MTAQAENPTGYGRIIRDHIGIVENRGTKDATPEEALVRNQYRNLLFDNEALFDALSKVGTNNAQGEYYLTDIIEILKKKAIQLLLIKRMILKNQWESMIGSR